MTFEYFKEKINGEKIINQNFLLKNKIGEGSFWSTFKVERNTDIEKNLYALKEGNLNFIIPDDHIIFDENENNEENYNKNFVENLDLIQFSNGENYENYDNYNDLEEMYNDKNIEKGFF